MRASTYSCRRLDGALIVPLNWHCGGLPRRLWLCIAGGGIRTLADSWLFEVGIDRIIIGSLVVKNLTLFEQLDNLVPIRLSWADEAGFVLCTEGWLETARRLHHLGIGSGICGTSWVLIQMLIVRCTTGPNASLQTFGIYHNRQSHYQVDCRRRTDLDHLKRLV